MHEVSGLGFAGLKILNAGLRVCVLDAFSDQPHDGRGGGVSNSLEKDPWPSRSPAHSLVRQKACRRFGEDEGLQVLYGDKMDALKNTTKRHMLQLCFVLGCPVCAMMSIMQIPRTTTLKRILVPDQSRHVSRMTAAIIVNFYRYH